MLHWSSNVKLNVGASGVHACAARKRAANFIPWGDVTWTRALKALKITVVSASQQPWQKNAQQSTSMPKTIIQNIEVQVKCNASKHIEVTWMQSATQNNVQKYQCVYSDRKTFVKKQLVRKRKCARAQVQECICSTETVLKSKHGCSTASVHMLKCKHARAHVQVCICSCAHAQLKVCACTTESVCMLNWELAHA